VLQELAEMRVIQFVEERLEIHIYHPSDWLRLDHFFDRFDRLMGAPPRSKAIRHRQKLLLVDRGENQLDGALHEFIFDRR
jgi:hypothetical protein